MVDLSREWERQKLEKKAAMGDFTAQEKLFQMMQEDWQHPPVEVDPAIEQSKEETKNNGGFIDNLKGVVLDTFKKDPIEAIKLVKEPNVINVLGNDGPIEKAIENTTIAAIDQGFKESSQPIWERDSSKKILGEDGTDKLQDALNPARWAENAIDDTPLSPENKDTIKKYLPIAAAAAGALILLSALK